LFKVYIKIEKRFDVQPKQPSFLLFYAGRKLRPLSKRIEATDIEPQTFSGSRLSSRFGHYSVQFVSSTDLCMTLAWLSSPNYFFSSK